MTTTTSPVRIDRAVKSALAREFARKGVRVSATSPEWADAKRQVALGHSVRTAVRLVLSTQNAPVQEARLARVVQAPDTLVTRALASGRVSRSGRNLIVSGPGDTVTFVQTTPPTPPTPPVVQVLSSQAKAVRDGRVMRDAKGRIVSREVAEAFAELNA